MITPISSLKELEEDMRDVDFFRSHLKDEIKLYLEAKVDNKFNRYHILKLGLFLHFMPFVNYLFLQDNLWILVLYKTDDMSKERLFKIFDELGDDTIGIMLLGYADIVATRKLLNPNEDMGVIKTYMEYVLTNYIYKYKQN